ncbi:hypothetical protein XFF6992_270008 [Xanthomonas citri pv. fuscans]|nr:hypothetical protein XFF6992_270008 [Xanthomonas citri pv. fuscans]SOO35481.1 hypothetical protein XFF6994_5370033 [Xanthomonas citri pv. fuscans]
MTENPLPLSNVYLLKLDRRCTFVTLNFINICNNLKVSYSSEAFASAKSNLLTWSFKTVLAHSTFKTWSKRLTTTMKSSAGFADPELAIPNLCP